MAAGYHPQVRAVEELPNEKVILMGFKFKLLWKFPFPEIQRLYKFTEYEYAVKRLKVFFDYDRHWRAIYHDVIDKELINERIIQDWSLKDTCGESFVTFLE
jgi:hypothetical protein